MTFPVAACYRTFTLVVVSNIYTCTLGLGTLQRMCERISNQAI